MSIRKKYLVIPGYIISQNDGQRHFIGASQLISLYKVNPEECVIDTERRGLQNEYKDLIRLEPNYMGNYKIPEKINTKGRLGLFPSVVYKRKGYRVIDLKRNDKDE